MVAKLLKPRRAEPPPSFIPDNALKMVGDYADRLGCEFQKRGQAAGRARDGSDTKRGREYNQLAHWLWPRWSGAQRSRTGNEKKIREGKGR